MNEYFRRISIYPFSVLVILVSISCNEDDSIEVNLMPECLNAEARNILNQEPLNPRATISRYLTPEDEEIYFVQETQRSVKVINSTCEFLCNIDDIGVVGDGNCPENVQQSQFDEIIWTDPR